MHAALTELRREKNAGLKKVPRKWGEERGREGRGKGEGMGKGEREGVYT